MRCGLTLLFVVATLVAVPVRGADNGLYLGAGAGGTSFSSGDLGAVDFDGDSSGYKVFAGYRFLSFVAVEASYVDFGNIKGGPKSAGEKASVQALAAEAVVFVPVIIADVFVKAGVSAWDADIRNIEELQDRFSIDGSDPVYGAGIQFRFRSFAVRAEVEYYDVSGADELYMYSIGGSYTF